MASNKPGPNNPQQAPAKIIDNPPQKSVAAALASGKAQVNKAGK